MEYTKYETNKFDGIMDFGLRKEKYLLLVQQDVAKGVLDDH